MKFYYEKVTLNKLPVISLVFRYVCGNCNLISFVVEKTNCDCLNKLLTDRSFCDLNSRHVCISALFRLKKLAYNMKITDL